MPKFRFLLVENPESSQGESVQWELPFERLVFDQRFEYQIEGAEKAERYRILGDKRDGEGKQYSICVDEGCREGGNPKKARP